MPANRIRVEHLLQAMKGKEFVYNETPLTILSFEFNGDICTMATNTRVFCDSCATMLSVLQNDFKSTDPELAMKQTQLPQVSNRQVSPATPIEARPVPELETIKLVPQMAATLMDNIKRIQADKDYLEQAQQVSLSVKVFVDLTKAEIDAVNCIQQAY